MSILLNLKAEARSDSLKPEYKLGAWKWDTEWLGEAISITDIDVVGGLQREQTFNFCELKKNTPILNRIQLSLFRFGLTHILVYFPAEWTPENSFECDTYKIYCPNSNFQVEKIKRGYLINDSAAISATKEEVRLILRGDSPWSCCGHFSIENRLNDKIPAIRFNGKLYQQVEG